MPRDSVCTALPAQLKVSVSEEEPVHVASEAAQDEADGFYDAAEEDIGDGEAAEKASPATEKVACCDLPFHYT